MFFCCVRGGEAAETSSKRLKLVVLGDGYCGKTCLLYRFVENRFVSDHIPTTIDTLTMRTPYKGQWVDLILMDTAGQEDYDRLRPYSYKDTDVIIICFALDDPSSLDNVMLRWVPEVRHFCGDVPILLVGNKRDLRDEPSSETDPDAMKSTIHRGLVPQFVPDHEGLAEAGKAGAEGYFECSAKTGEGVEAILEAVLKTGYQSKFSNSLVKRFLRCGSRKGRPTSTLDKFIMEP